MRTTDLILWGATGFTGRLVAEYLLTHAPKGLKWALGGRSKDKLEALKAELTAKNPAAAQLPLVLGDARDVATLDAFVPTAKVIVTTVGPFLKHGRELAAACARHGTHYLDLTGEAPFVRELIDSHEEEARRTGAMLIPCSGFDSIPSDLGVLVLQDFLTREAGRPATAVRSVVRKIKGGFSGGTAASALLMAELAGEDKTVRRRLVDPYVLVPNEPRGPDARDEVKPAKDPILDVWTGPWVMASINTRVVRRTNYLLGYPWGRDFRYSEVLALGAGPKGLARAAGLSAGMVAFFGAASTALGRNLLNRVLPQAGEGPSETQRTRGSFLITFYGSAAGVDAEADVRGVQDPGYGETAKMLSEAALAVLEKKDAKGGILTPASALGMGLVERLRRAGMTFEARRR